MPNFSTVCKSQKLMPTFEALKRAEDAILNDRYQRKQSPQCVRERALEAACQRDGFADIPAFTRSLPKVEGFDLVAYLATPENNGPFEVHACGYPSTEQITTRAADAHALQYTGEGEFAEVFNAKKEVIASYFDPRRPFWTYVVEGYDSATDSGMDWFVHMRLSMAELELDVKTFETEEELYRYAEEILPNSNSFTGMQALVVAKLDLDEAGRLLHYPQAKVMLEYQYGDVFECHESVPEAFKQAHPVCEY